MSTHMGCNYYPYSWCNTAPGPDLHSSRGVRGGAHPDFGDVDLTDCMVAQLCSTMGPMPPRTQAIIERNRVIVGHYCASDPPWTLDRMADWAVKVGLMKSCTTQCMSKILREAYLKPDEVGARRVSDYAEYIPWSIPVKYNNNHVYRMLLLYGRERKERRMSAIERGMLRNWKAQMDLKNEIVYNFDAENGSFLTRRRKRGEAGKYVIGLNGVAH